MAETTLSPGGDQPDTVGVIDDKPTAVTNSDQPSTTMEIGAHIQPTGKQTPFDLPELFTNVLEFLDPLEIVVAMRINKAANHLIRTTPALQRAMGLHPQPDSSFWIPILGQKMKDYFDRAGISCRTAGPNGPLQEVLLNFHIGIASHNRYGPALLKFPEAATVGSKMMLCQPPKRIMMHLHCYSSSGDCNFLSGFNHDWVGSELGVTFDQVVTTAKTLRQRHATRRLGSTQETQERVDCPRGGTIVIECMVAGQVHDSEVFAKLPKLAPED
ncbi:uncharacterized protein LTR77_001569 [Saxophila tyrrhenica]|uniref:F-box domain-containing protein n=1 Tax=Saxophila tyrrhenica TaxID=1690608 RepID=A0AAV9PP23_9PEZI|nr:hypothetical protein LTR77_001569 [Saxophila tyrrhenica]